MKEKPSETTGGATSSKRMRVARARMEPRRLRCVYRKAMGFAVRIIRRAPRQRGACGLKAAALWRWLKLSGLGRGVWHRMVRSGWRPL
jgi:hypothetical protein